MADPGTWTAVATVLGAGVGAAAALKKPKVPELEKPAPMADQDALDAARRRRAAEMQQRGGRASTILSQDDKLGG
jgi:hypothetical protein